MECEPVWRALQCLQGRVWSDEYDLQDAIEDALNSASISFSREKPLGPKDRPDFLLEHGVIVEVKVDGSASSVMRQLDRYLAHDDISAVVLVTTRSYHSKASGECRGKPIHVLWLRGL